MRIWGQHCQLQQVRAAGCTWSALDSCCCCCTPSAVWAAAVAASSAVASCHSTTLASAPPVATVLPSVPATCMAQTCMARRWGVGGESGHLVGRPPCAVCKAGTADVGAAHPTLPSCASKVAVHSDVRTFHSFSSASAPLLSSCRPDRCQLVSLAGAGQSDGRHGPPSPRVCRCGCS